MKDLSIEMSWEFPTFEAFVRANQEKFGLGHNSDGYYLREPGDAGISYFTVYSLRDSKNEVLIYAKSKLKEAPEWLNAIMRQYCDTYDDWAGSGWLTGVQDDLAELAKSFEVQCRYG